MVSFKWLHLTDLHLGMAEQQFLFPVIKDKFFEDLKRVHDRCGPWDLLVFTGDLTLRGSKDEFAKVDEFLGHLSDFLTGLSSKPPKFVAVPGNHDLVRPQPDPKKPQPADVILLRSWAAQPEVQKAFWDDADSSYRKTVNNAFENYNEWWHRLSLKPEIRSGLLPGDFSATIEKEGALLGIVGLNSTFLQLADGPYEGKLVVDRQQFQEVCDGDGPLWVKKHNACLLLTHQPPNWLTGESQEQLVADIAGYNYFAAHLFGHMHESRYTSSSEAGAAKLRSCQGTSLFGLEYGPENKLDRRHGYSVGEIRIEDHKGFLVQWPRKAAKPGGQWNFAADGVDFVLTDEHTYPEEITLLRPLEKIAARAEAPNESPPVAEVPSPFSRQWAVMIGINNYEDTTKLLYCRQDVIDLADAFRKSLGFRPENVFEFHEDSELKPQRDGILRKLVDLRSEVKPDDLFIFYFSGHGVNEGGKDYLLPMGCPPRDVKTLGIQVQDLADMLRQLECKNTALFIDACRQAITRDATSGAKTADAISVGEESKTVLKDSGIVAFFSCDPWDQSFEIDELKHGSFTYCLLQAINEGAAETASELETYLQQRVPNINKDYKKEPQRPYAVIAPPERGSLEIFFNPHWRRKASLKFDPLIDRLIELYNKGENVIEQLGFLDQVREKKQLDQIEKNRITLIEAFCNNEMGIKMFLRIWKSQSGGHRPPPQMKRPDKIS